MVNFSSLGPKPARPELREVFDWSFSGGRLRLGPKSWHFIRDCVVLYVLVSVSARSVPGLLGQISENFSMSFFRGGGCLWAQCFAIDRKSAWSSTLCGQFQLARSQARSARTPRSFRLEFFGGEIASGAQILAFHKRARGALRLGVCFSSLRSRPARPDLREVFDWSFSGGRLRLGPKSWHFIRERVVLYVLVSVSARSVPGLLGQISENFSMSFFRGGGCLWAQCFAIDRKSAWSSTLCGQFQLARSQARSARTPRSFRLEFFGGRLRLGPKSWHFIRERVVLYVLGSVSARSVPGLLGQISEKFSIGVFWGGDCVWGPNLGIS